MPPHELRLYRLCKVFGWTITEALEQPATLCDWLLTLAAEDERVQAEREQARSERRS